MLSINPQRGKAEKLRLMYACKCENCSTGLCLTLLLLLALEAFMQQPLVGGKTEALSLRSASSSRLSLSRLVRAEDQVLWDQGRDQAGLLGFLLSRGVFLAQVHHIRRPEELLSFILQLCLKGQKVLFGPGT